MDRRGFLRGSGTLLGALGLLSSAEVLAACGGKGTSAQGGGDLTDTLVYAFLLDMQVPDPDIFYEGEGLGVTLSAYEGLIRYANDSPDFEPVLAESWDVAPDGLTYTFHLRQGITFHDGTPCDAESWVKGFERRTAVNQGPAYMLAHVASTEAPDPATFVVHLAQPVQPLLDYFACPWSPKAVSPTAVAENADGDDLAQAWLTTHDAGSGPYTIAEFEPGSHYTLEAFPGYWGDTPAFSTVRIEIIPDVTTQRLKFEQGEVNLITKGLPIADIETFEGRPDEFTVTKLPAAIKTALYVNPNRPMFADKAIRQALGTALDRPALLEPTYGSTAELSTEFYPPGMMPEGTAPDDPEYDTSALEEIVAGLDSKTVDLAYDEQGGATDRRLAELIQTQLQALGLDVTVRGIPTSQAFAMFETPVDQQPDLMLNVAGGDALNPDTQLRIFYRTGAAPLNWFNYTLPELDEAMDAAQAATTKEAAYEGFAAAADLVIDQGWVVNIGDLQDVILTSAGIGGIVHDLAAGRQVRLESLTKT
jgi:peptide/nickel transport system substrate-binding protein